MRPLILLSVGTQFPFDRLTRVVDLWAKETGRDDIVAQIGPSRYKPEALKTFDLISPDEFARLQAEAELIVAHAGMGSILGAMEASTPLIIMPRDHERGEHRNGHQMATARRFEGAAGIYVAYDEVALRQLLDRSAELDAAAATPDSALPQFVAELKAFVDQDVRSPSLISRAARMVRSLW
ncbi:glycosyltransferase [Sphingomonas sp. ID0503]|uniref:glycosyltransferase n=1 Tax=Sphingomonas sp. ID0503 TaxID=3399691 RepID=UPI003AFB25F2